MNQDKASLKDSEFVELVVSFKDVTYYLAHLLNKDTPNEMIYDLVNTIVMLTFNEFYPDDEREFRSYVYAMDKFLEELFPDETERENVFSEINKIVLRIIKSIVPMYNRYKEVNKAFLYVKQINTDNYILTIESRIF